MSTARISVQLVSPCWVSGQDPIAVAEVVSAPGGGGKPIPPIKRILGVNDAPQEVAVEEGTYVVRVFMPGGDVQAEQVRAVGTGVVELRFELAQAPCDWLASAFSLGTAQPLPRKAEALRLMQALRQTKPASSGTDPSAASPGDELQRDGGVDLGKSRFEWELASHAAQVIDRQAMTLQAIGGAARVGSIEGRRLKTRMDPARSLPAEPLSTGDLVSWWTGSPDGEPEALLMRPDERDGRNARLALARLRQGATIGTSADRMYAAVRDPQGNRFYAVYPEGWASTSPGNIGAVVPASVLMTIGIEAALTALDRTGESVCWRCVPEVDDVQAMSLLGFLSAGQAAAGQLILAQARDWLYGKTVNPVAAAAGAYLLLLNGREANERFAANWRKWIANLYKWYPYLPDGAIAMARMALAYGETTVGDDIDVEQLRGYALDAVRRGLPYLGAGVRILTDILIAIQGDDEATGREGAPVDNTRRALSLLRQLGRISVPGSFFTVLRVEATDP